MEKLNGGHVLAVPFPSQGHINPMHQFCKRLVEKGLKTTLAITTFISNSMPPDVPSGPVGLTTISDGYDDGGFARAESIEAYLTRFKAAGSKSLAEAVARHKKSDNPVTCIVYDAFMPWALDVARQFGLLAAAFFTQPCGVNYIYYLVYRGKLQLPVSSTPVSIEGLPLLEPQDMPSFIYVQGSYPAYFDLVLDQFYNADKADFVLVNTFYKLESQEVTTMCKAVPILTIGPTIPSIYLDKCIEMDNKYDLNLFETKDLSFCTKWLDSKPEGSVVYVSFGSMANLNGKQMEELAWALSNFYFLWVVRASEEAKLPAGFIEKIDHDKGLIVNWTNQLEVLSNKAICCFFTHCGWNSTFEALSLGVPMIAMPQWTDQPTNAKYVEDVWRIGVRVKVNEDGISRKEDIEFCIREVTAGERGKEMKRNAKKWRDLAIEAVDRGGTSDTNIEKFVSHLAK